RAGLLFVQLPAQDDCAGALAIVIDAARIGGADAPREALPLRLRGGEQVLGAADGIEEAVDGRAVARGPGAVEGIADERDRPLGAELLHDLLHGDGAPVPSAFELRAEIPERERGVGLAL